MLLLAILVYITLDFSLPAMPGAFVFEPAESVETTQRSNGGRSGSDVVVTLPLATGPFVVSPLRVAPTEGLASSREVRPVTRFVGDHLARAMLAPTPPTEDPH